jgi:hypothetical protein
VQAHRHRRLAERLDRLFELHAASLELDAVLVEEVDEVLRGHGAEELALLGRLAALLVSQRLDAGPHGLGLRGGALGLGVRLLLDVVQVLEVALGGAERQLLGNQEVPRITVGDVAHLAAPPDLADVLEQNDFHGVSPSTRTAARPPCARA